MPVKRKRKPRAPKGLGERTLKDRAIAEATKLGHQLRKFRRRKGDDGFQARCGTCHSMVIIVPVRDAPMGGRAVNERCPYAVNR